MRQWGASAEDLAMAESLMGQTADEDVDVCDVWPENWAAVQLFLQVQRQWVYAGMDLRRTGLNWPGIEVVARALGWRGKAWGEVVQALLVMEGAVITVDNEQAKA